MIGALTGSVPGRYDVSRVVDSNQLKFLKKIAHHTGRPLSEFKGSASGALGYMVLLPATFYLYAQDGNDDHVKDPLNPYDSVATGAYFLAQELAKTESIKAALEHYNPDPGFVENVLKMYQEMKSGKR